MRACDADRVVATRPAATVTGVEKIKPLAATQEERPFHQRPFPRRIIPEQFLWFAQEFGALVVQLLRPDRSRCLTAVAIFFPNQIALPFFVRDRNRINGTGRLRHQYTAISVGTRGFV